MTLFLAVAGGIVVGLWVYAHLRAVAAWTFAVLGIAGILVLFSQVPRLENTVGDWMFYIFSAWLVYLWFKGMWPYLFRRSTQ